MQLRINILELRGNHKSKIYNRFTKKQKERNILQIYYKRKSSNHNRKNKKKKK